ncbi:ArsR/SmtB family transcription factor [Pseudonocardia thermophila]|uniref:ArsR/SmtB family transcription factor n=1 Tax=Pseudonocardia thermophila TaxID=1848 RepID=UPI00248D431E|nr:helix-turn-helix domain-containing protein [Pseudonocardia thermophila]
MRTRPGRHHRSGGRRGGTGPVRARILTELATAPGSASSLARTLGIPRQKINYHLRQLEEHGIVQLIEERRRSGLTERADGRAADRGPGPGPGPRLRARRGEIT